MVLYISTLAFFTVCREAVHPPLYTSQFSIVELSKYLLKLKDHRPLVGNTKHFNV